MHLSFIRFAARALAPTTGLSPYGHTHGISKDWVMIAGICAKLSLLAMILCRLRPFAPSQGYRPMLTG
jgi:hypothetical protein